MDSIDDARLHWNELPQATRSDLINKLEGLYGFVEDEAAFDALAEDKQQGLLLFLNRLKDLNLWQEIERIENVYGIGGVGMNFRARSTLSAKLAEHRKFTSRFATHGDCAEGFFEVGRARAALHLLRMKDDARGWAVHFDLYAPVSTPLSAFSHFWREKWRGETPDWREIKASLV
jgi:hypothetical protein